MYPNGKNDGCLNGLTFKGWEKVAGMSIPNKILIFKSLFPVSLYIKIMKMVFLKLI